MHTKTIMNPSFISQGEILAALVTHDDFYDKIIAERHHGIPYTLRELTQTRWPFEVIATSMAALGVMRNKINTVRNMYDPNKKRLFTMVEVNTILDKHTW